MKKNLIIILAMIAGLSFLPAAHSQERKNEDVIKPIEIELADEAAVVIGGIRITLSDAIRTAIEKNHDILTGKYDVAMTDTFLKQYEAKYNTKLSAGAGYSSKDYPDIMQSQYGTHKDVYDLSASLSKSFSSGTTVTAGVQDSYSKFEDYSIEKAYGPVIFFSVQQELLKNFFGYNDRRENQILKNTAQMQKDAIIYQLSLVVVNVIVDYWNVIIYKTHMDNAQLMLQETKRVRRIISDNVKLGLAEQFELNLWNSLVASAEASVAQAEQQYKDALRNFLQTIDMNGEISFTGKAILSNRLPEINVQQAIKTAYTKRVDYLNAKKSLENARLQLEMYENDSLPSLTGNINITSMDYNQKRGEAYENTAGIKYPEFEASVKLSYPLDDQQQQVNERNARWQIEQAKQAIKKYERIVTDDVTSKYESINTSYKLYLKAKEAREQAEIYYSRMLTNLRRGRFTASVVRDALDALVNSREQELRALVGFNASLLAFEVAKNELFESYRIDVEKYIPKE